MTRAAGGVFVLFMAMPLAAQTTMPVVVTQLAGVNVYVDLVTPHQLQPGDTVSVLRAGTAGPARAMLVVASTASRCVLAFVGEPFPITRGDTLQLTAAVVVPPLAAPATGVTVARPRAPGPSVVGIVAVEFNGMQSTTTGLGADAEKVTRTYAIPGVRLYAQARGLPGGGSLSLQGRVDYRSGGNIAFDPAASAHIYAARLDQPLGTQAARLTLGRFVNEYDPLSGYWDGGQLFVGKDRNLGAGVAAGFEPRRANEGVTTVLPKYGVFATVGTANRLVTAYTNVSAVLVTPRDGRADQLASSWSSRVSTPAFRFGHDVLAERDQNTGDWRIGRFHAQGALTPSPQFELSAGYAYDAPEIVATGVTVVRFRRQRWTAGVAWWGPAAYVTADIALNRRAEGTRAWTYSGGAGIPALGGGVGLRVSGSYWSEATNRGLLIAPIVDRSFGSVHGRVGYQFYRTAADRYTIVTHRGDVQADIGLRPGLYAVVRASGQYGAHVTSLGISASLVWRFGP